MSEAEKQTQDEAAPHAKQRAKQADRYKKNLKGTKVTEEWVEFTGDRQSPKGRKVVLCSRTANGVNRQYIGRELEKKDLMNELKRAGLKFKE